MQPSAVLMWSIVIDLLQLVLLLLIVPVYESVCLIIIMSLLRAIVKHDYMMPVT